MYASLLVIVWFEWRSLNHGEDSLCLWKVRVFRMGPPLFFSWMMILSSLYPPFGFFNISFFNLAFEAYGSSSYMLFS